MKEKGRATLKSYFETGDRPTQKQFEDLIDSQINKLDDNIEIGVNENDETEINFGIEESKSNLNLSGNLSVSGNMTVQGESIVRKVVIYEGDVQLGNEDTDKISIYGFLQGANTDTQIQIKSPIRVNGDIHNTGDINTEGNLLVTGDVEIGTIGNSNVKINGVLKLGDTDVVQAIQHLEDTKVNREGDNINGDLHINGSIDTVGNITSNGNLTSDGNLVIAGDVELGSTSGNNVKVNGALKVGDTDIVQSIQHLEDSKVNREGDNINGDLHINGSIDTVGNIISNGNLTSDGNLLIAGDVELGSTSSNNVKVNGVLKVGDTNVILAIQNLEEAKVNRTGDNIEGDLNIEGNVGIGITNPTVKLQVNGTIKADNYLKTDGTPISSGGSKWEGTNNIFYTNGNVGIGTTNPGAKLDVAGTIQGDYLVVNRQNASGEGGEMRLDGSGGADNIQIDNYYGNLRLHTLASNKQFQVLGGGAYIAGNVGIGKSSPEAKLDVNGNIRTKLLNFNYPGRDSQQAYDHYGIYQERGAWKAPYPDLVINNHTGIKYAAYCKYGGHRFYSGYSSDGTPTTEALSIGNGDHNVRVSHDLNIAGNLGIGTAPSHIIHVKGNGAVGLFESTQNNAYLRLSTNEGFDRRVEFTNRPGGRASIWVSRAGDAFNVTRDGNVGIGITNPGKDRLDVRGRAYCSDGWRIFNSDYAEYFESQNKTEIPDGISVKLNKKGMLEVAQKGEIPFGIISINPGIVGNSPKDWPKKYLRDEFGNQIMEEYKEEIRVPKMKKIKKERQKVVKKKIKEEITKTEVVLKGKKYRQLKITEKITREVEEPIFKEFNLYDEKGKKIIGKHKIPVMETFYEEIEEKNKNGEPVMAGTGKFKKIKRPKINPDYDPDREYISRENRPEWNCVGLLGQLPLRKGLPVAPTWTKIKDISEDVELWLVK